MPSRPSRRYSKNSRRSRKTSRYQRKYRKYSPKIGIVRVMRWSSKDSVNNCHLLLQGNDALPDTTGAVTFTLSDVQSYGELQSLFDNYTITRVLYRWVVTRSTDWASTTTNRGWSTRIAWAHDFNDSTPISQANLFQRAGLREVYLNTDRLQTKWFSLKPAILAQMYEGTTLTAYSPKWRQYIDTADLAPFYGIKYAVQNLYAGINLRLEAKIFGTFKGIS